MGDTITRESTNLTNAETPGAIDFVSLRTRAPKEWSRRISAARIRLLFQTAIDEHHFYFIGTFGAIATGVISRVWGSSPLPMVAIGFWRRVQAKFFWY